jgi:hypothetical protein
MKLLSLLLLSGVCSVAALAAQPPAAPPATTLVIDGETYEDVKYLNATASKITFRHRRGVASLPIEKFPPEVQRRFGFNPQKAQEERAAEEALLREFNERAAADAAARADADKRLQEQAQRKLSAERDEMRRAEEEKHRREQQRGPDAPWRDRWQIVVVNPNLNPPINPNLKRHADAKFNQMQSAIHSGNLQRVQQLINRDATYLTARGDDGETPLHYAASVGADMICGILIDAKADINARDNRGRTPLRWALDAGKTATADYLRKRGGSGF